MEGGVEFAQCSAEVCVDAETLEARQLLIRSIGEVNLTLDCLTAVHPKPPTFSSFLPHY